MVGAFLWSISDVIQDACIKEDGGEDEHKDNDKKDLISISALKSKHEERLSGIQGSLVSGLVMLFVVLFLHMIVGDKELYAYYDHYHQNAGISDGQGPATGVHPKIITIAAVASGSLQCAHLIYFLKSFEGSSSTVIVPLMQLNSVFVLPFTIILSILSQFYPILAAFHKIITFKHLLAFSLIFIGGFYPSLDGNLSTLTKASFWRQYSVRQILISDFFIAVYYLLVSFCTNEPGAMSNKSFFILSIYGNCLTFLVLVVFLRQYRKAALSLMTLSRKYILLAVAGESFSLVGYFFVSISYHLYYNSGIVSAAEGALNQLFNLLLAISLKKLFNFGREVERINEKLFSCLVVSIGLVLTSSM
ncbi:hypothetical protein DLAC_05733 [Tieghemostelium lacteum]|uniref:Transmembrane protein n=1 Tax=Tieghemostelium lacteum TaxID=361077 RepID=A0A151ZGK7_TIELA|nr:hypothetical protein DLAC_05733 [Tieghemostelium lacteum]|eukprot:KYQ93106.1 hypothetical protein DLAC_05733 [Tieghemostelium lacteum]